MISPELLRRYPFFGFMDDVQLKAVAMIAEKMDFAPEQTIVEAGRPASALYFLIDGDVAYYHIAQTENDPSYHKEYFINDLNPGEIFGISALIEPFLYMATARVEHKTCHVVRIDALALRSLCEVDVRLSAGLMRAVARAAMERLEHTRVLLIARS